MLFRVHVRGGYHPEPGVDVVCSALLPVMNPDNVKPGGTFRWAYFTGVLLLLSEANQLIIQCAGPVRMTSSPLFPMGIPVGFQIVQSPLNGLPIMGFNGPGGIGGVAGH